MFFHKKSETNWPMIIFGIIIFVFVILIIGILVIFVGKVKNKEFGNSQKNGDVTFEVSTPESVREKYESQVKELIKKLENDEDFSSVWEDVRPSFFTLRVPEEKLSLHLDVFLELQEMAKSGKGNKEKAIEFLNTLL